MISKVTSGFKSNTLISEELFPNCIQNEVTAQCLGWTFRPKIPNSLVLTLYIITHIRFVETDVVDRVNVLDAPMQVFSTPHKGPLIKDKKTANEKETF